MTPVGEKAALGFMVCVNNSGYPASLEVGKSYKVLPDDNAEPDEIRVVDESGEDYLYPAEYFSSERRPLAAWQAEPSDIERQARAFVEENESLLSGGSPTVLGRVYVQGANIFVAFNEEVIEAANRAASAKNALADAIRNPTTPPRRLQELEEEEARASGVYEARITASRELDDFLQRVKILLPEHDIDE